MKMKWVAFKKKVLAIVLLLGVLSACTTSVYADDDSIEIIPGLKVSSEGMPLYNLENEVVGLYLSGIDGGYAIVDTQGSIIEFSYANEIEEIENTDNICYYSGACEYYIADSFNSSWVTEIETDKKVKKEQLNNFETKEKETVLTQGKTSGKTCTITFPDGVVDGEGKGTYTIRFSYAVLVERADLSSETRYFSYNDNGTCGSTAAAIMMYYYYDYIDTNYITNSTYRCTRTSPSAKPQQKAFVMHLRKVIGDDGSGTTYTKLRNGINNYLKEIKKSQNCTFITKRNILFSWVSTFQSCIDNGKPCIVGLTKEPTYGEHWVVGVGYLRYFFFNSDGAGAYLTFVKANDGWGENKNNIVYISSEYADGVIYLK